LSVPVDLISAVQTRYARVSDRLKATWTLHQFACGATRHFLTSNENYELDLDPIYEQMKTLAGMLNGTWPGVADATSIPFMQVESALDAAARKLLAIEAKVTPPLLRRFFERL
jgi:hypothetical protein